MEMEISSVTESQSLTAMSLFLVLSSPVPLGSHYKSVHLKLILGMYVPLVNNFFCPVCDGVSEMVDSFIWGNKQ